MGVWEVVKIVLRKWKSLRRNAQVTSEQRLAKAEAEKQYMFEKINLTENSSSHHKVVVVEETRHMCDVLKDLWSTSW